MSNHDRKQLGFIVLMIAWSKKGYLNDSLLSILHKGMDVYVNLHGGKMSASEYRKFNKYFVEIERYFNERNIKYTPSISLLILIAYASWVLTVLKNPLKVKAWNEIEDAAINELEKLKSKNDYEIMELSESVSEEIILLWNRIE